MQDKRRLRIFHPTDFSRESHTAFAHALKLTLDTQGALDILHVRDGKDHKSEDIPKVRKMLEQWGTLPPNSPKSAVADLHLGVRKIIKKKENPVDACVDFLEYHLVDLIVMMIHQQKPGWLKRRVGAPIARESNQISLFIPDTSAGFVNADTGELSLQHVLIPVAAHPSARQGISNLQTLQQSLGLEKLKVTYLHVGNDEDLLQGAEVTVPTWDIDYQQKSGNPAEKIVATAKKLDVDMTLMVTEGRDGFLDALRGSISEQVLKNIHCPLLVIPASEAYN